MGPHRASAAPLGALVSVVQMFISVAAPPASTPKHGVAGSAAGPTCTQRICCLGVERSQPAVSHGTCWAHSALSSGQTQGNADPRGSGLNWTGRAEILNLGDQMPARVKFKFSPQTPRNSILAHSAARPRT